MYDSVIHGAKEYIVSEKAVILLSGGLDSLTCMAIAKDQGYQLYPISFDYQQRHHAELDAARGIAVEFNATHKIINMHEMGHLGGSALTDQNISVADYSGDGEIPATYVPARNIVFLSIALGYAEIIEADKIFIGVSSVDYSGYPDCRPEFIDAFQRVADVGIKRGVEGNGIQIMSPLIHLSKAETIQLGTKLGVDYSQSVSCYRANQQGEACGRCDSCILRQQGFAAAGIADPTRYIQKIVE